LSPSNSQTATFFESDSGKPRLAYLQREAWPQSQKPGLIWLGGFRSDMRGGKATFLDEFAANQGRAYLRFDYSGHGESEGAFEDGAIGDWAAEALAIFRALTKGPQIVIGSSMGGWIALLLARALAASGEADRLAGIVLIAPAVDFTEELIWPQLPDAVKETLQRDGVWLRPATEEGPGYPLTRRLFEDGRNHLLLGGEIRSWCPVRILQGMQDAAAPWRHTMKLVEHLAADPVIVTLIKDGVHNLSRPQDLAALQNAVEQTDADFLT